MKQLFRELTCFWWGHDEGIQIWHGWAVTSCRRCREILWTEVLRETPA